MKGHETAIHSISVHTSGRYALTTSSDTAQLWDLDTFQRKRKLTIKEDVGIVQVTHISIQILAVCELVYKPEARVEQKACRSIRTVCKVARRVDLNFEVKF